MDKVRLKHMISPLAKHKRQLQTSSKCRIEACTNVLLLGYRYNFRQLQGLVSKGLCLVSELLYFKILQILTQIRATYFKLQFLQ